MGARRKAGVVRLGLLLCVVAAVLVLPSMASADLSFCPPGEGAGQCSEPRGLATDFETARLYVADTANNRIDVFKAENGEFLFAFGWGVDTGAAKLEKCTTASGCQAGIAGSGAGQLSAPRMIAVDNIVGSASRHDLYVAEPTGGGRVQKFGPGGELLPGFSAAFNDVRGIAISIGGTVYVADTKNTGLCKADTSGSGATFQKRVLKFTEIGTPIETVEPTDTPCGQISAFVADSAGDFYFVNEGRFGALRKYASTATTASCTRDEGIATLSTAVDEAGDLFIAQRIDGVVSIVEYDSACLPVRRFGYGEIEAGSQAAAALAAFHGPQGDVFVAEPLSSGNRINYLKTPPPGPIVIGESVEASPVRSVWASLGAQINPEGKQTTARVEYVDEEEFLKSGFTNAVSGPPAAVPSNEVKRLQLPAEATAGRYKLKLLSQGTTTVELPYNASAAQVQGAIGDLPSIGSPNVSVTGAFPEYQITFIGALAGTDVSPLELQNGSPPLTAGNISFFVGGEVTTVFAGGLFNTHPGEAIAGCRPFSEQALAEGKCLKPETAYRFRIIAENADGEDEAEGQFTTRPPLEIEQTYATEASTDGVTLDAVLDPLGSAATGYFEYVDDASFQESGFAQAKQIPDVSEGQAPLDFGAGEEGTLRSATLESLPVGATFHYRLVVTDPFTTLEGPERSFTTLRTPVVESCPVNAALRIGAAALLPDCRAHEMVSPLDKAGGEIVTLRQRGTTLPAVANQSAVAGERVTYGSTRSFGDAKSAPYTSQYLSERTPAGWQSEGIGPQAGKSIVGAVVFDFEFRAFDAELCEAWLVPLFDPPLAEGAGAGHRNLYRREGLCDGEEEYAAISVGEPEVLTSRFQVEPQGRSEGNGVTAFAANDRLVGTEAPPEPASCTDATPGECEERLYVKGPGLDPPRYACILPSGAASTGRCSAGTGASQLIFGTFKSPQMDGALSGDGRRLYWTSSVGINTEGGRIYLRENPLEEQSALAHGGAEGTGTLTEGSNKVTVLTAAAGTAAFTAGSPTVTLLSTTVGRFVAGQPVTAPGKVPSGTSIKEVSGNTLTLDKNATATSAETPISSRGPMPFAVGQTIAGAGIPAGTTITAVALGSLTLSANATASAAATSLEASSECTEPAKACTVAVSRPAEEAAGTTASRFWTAAKGKGATAFYSSGKNLYEYDAGSGASEPIAGGFVGVLGASDDARRLYLVSSEVLSGEEENSEGDKAQAGARNLYLYETDEGGGAYTFIGRLASGDVVLHPKQDNTSATAAEPGFRNARVSADGDHLAFVSEAPLTGYDNTDASSPVECGKPGGICDNQVFVYDAGAQELRCVSCNPSGVRPAGADLGVAGAPFWAAARIKGFETSLYASRNLADDGSRLYFESQDPLVARDTNGRLDVYQWERLGTGGCEEADVSFSVSAGGCVDLISSGKSALDSEFVDASASGDDVFFTTLASLYPADPGLVDLYDARVEGGFPGPASPAPSCEGEACQGTPEAPNDPTPASESFQGAGNVTVGAPLPASRKPCAKGKVKRRGKCVAKKHKHAPKRAKHNRRAGR